MTHTIDPIDFSIELMRHRSVSGEQDQGALDALQAALEPLGFTCHRLPFEGNGGHYAVDNLFAVRPGDEHMPHLAFAGHTDVVPTGDENAWSIHPFAPQVVEGNLIGRGAVDMKAAIAAWVAAISEFLATNSKAPTLSLIITGDEEAEAKNGTVRMLEWMQEHNHIPHGCVVGEPTNPSALGEMIKIGRRGSQCFGLTVNGTQGHVAYPEHANNPIPALTEILHRLQTTHFDEGNEFFPPTNLEVTSVDVGNTATNVIPADAKAKFNVRFNNEWNREQIIAWVTKQCDTVTDRYTLDVPDGSESFLSPIGPLSQAVSEAVEAITGKVPAMTTTGGTSDARFIRNICPVVECGLINETAHQIDESVAANDIASLAKIYLHIISNYQPA